MNKIIFAFIAAALAALSPTVHAQVRRCGNQLLIQRMSAADPAAMTLYRAQQNAAIVAALSQAAAGGTAQKSTSGACQVPVAFHFVVTNTQFNQLGGNKGITDRVLSNLATINRDFNRRNGDSSSIPAYFKSAYGNPGIQFGLAKMTTSRTISPGIELLIVDTGKKYDVNNSCANAKVSGSGLPPWDVSKYLNVWICKIIDPAGSPSDVILGVTVPHSIVGATTPDHHTFQSSELGVVITPFAFGTSLDGSGNYISGTDLGRTLTHEMGHFFELSHTWGDDDNAPGHCPDNGGFDDGFTDTPPEYSANYGSPSGVKTDGCSKTAPGIMYQNYMDYSDDRVLVMFTNQQAAFMAATISNNRSNASLTTDCSLSYSPAYSYLAVGDVNKAPDASVNVWPNPAAEVLNLAINGSAQPQAIDLVNMLGQPVAHITPNGAKSYTMSLVSLPRGVYTLACRFETGMITKKIALQ